MASRNPGAESAPVERITRSIVVLRGHRVLLDAELAELYGVRLKALNQAVKRNGERFPEDFMFRLTGGEWEALRSQFVTLEGGRGRYRKYLPFAFTEHGAIMAATMLNSPQAVEMSIYVVRAFVRLRELLASNKELAKRLDELETRIVRRFGTYDQAIAGILAALRDLQVHDPPIRTVQLDLQRISPSVLRSQIVTSEDAALPTLSRVTICDPRYSLPAA